MTATSLILLAIFAYCAYIGDFTLAVYAALIFGGGWLAYAILNSLRIAYQRAMRGEWY